MRTVSNAHTGFVGNSGVQAHSAGEHFPVLSYCIGSADHRVAAFQGVRRDSYNGDDHADNLRRLKRAEIITDAIFADRDGGCGYPDGSDGPDRGYCVSLADHETRFDSLEGAYGAVYRDVVEKLEFIESHDVDGCVGWWTRDGVTYLDVSTVESDFEDAVAIAVQNDQIAIYDLASGVEIDV